MLASRVAHRFSPPAKSSPFLLSFIVLAFVMCFLASCWVLLAETRTEILIFYIEAGWLFVFGACYLRIGKLRSLSWCGITGLFTMRGMLSFGVVPMWRAYNGSDTVDGLHVKAMFVVLVGFVAFWVGSLMLIRPVQRNFEATPPRSTNRIETGAIVSLILGVGVEVLLWKVGLHSYLADSDLRRSAAPIAQWLFVLETLLPSSLVICAIELFGNKSSSPAIRVTFWLSLIANLILGLVSGMKSELLMPFVLLTLVYGITEGRFPRSALLLPLLFLVAYPFVNAYRNNLNNGYREQAMTAGGLGNVLKKSFEDASFTSQAARHSYIAGGADDTSARLSLLSPVKSIIGLPSPEFLNGDEKLWMAPIYPFIPRIIWKDKPILNKGQRLSIALGVTDTTSTALTPIGDLYTYGGILPVAIGMLLYGVACQALMNWIPQKLGPKAIFFLLSVLPQMSNLESDFFSLIAAGITMVVMSMVIASIIYGGRMTDLRTPTT